MAHRPFPDSARALRHVQRTRAFYLYGRFPQRYVLGFDQSEPAADSAPGRSWAADRGRARRQLVHLVSEPPGAAEHRAVVQEHSAAHARTGQGGLAAMAATARRWSEQLERAGAPRSAPLPVQILAVAAPRVEQVLAQSAPEVLGMVEMARRVRRSS